MTPRQEDHEPVVKQSIWAWNSPIILPCYPNIYQKCHENVFSRVSIMFISIEKWILDPKG